MYNTHISLLSNIKSISIGTRLARYKSKDISSRINIIVFYNPSHNIKLLKRNSNWYTKDPRKTFFKFQLLCNCLLSFLLFELSFVFQRIGHLLGRSILIIDLFLFKAAFAAVSNTSCTPCWILAEHST